MQFVPGQLDEDLGLLKMFLSPWKLSRCWQVVMVSEDDYQTVVGINMGFIQNHINSQRCSKPTIQKEGMYSSMLWERQWPLRRT